MKKGRLAPPFSEMLANVLRGPPAQQRVLDARVGLDGLMLRVMAVAKLMAVGVDDLK